MLYHLCLRGSLDLNRTASPFREKRHLELEASDILDVDDLGRIRIVQRSRRSRTECIPRRGFIVRLKIAHNVLMAEHVDTAFAALGTQNRLVKECKNVVKSQRTHISCNVLTTGKHISFRRDFFPKSGAFFRGGLWLFKKRINYCLNVFLRNL
ncbi:hypothetical protein Ae201684_004815 [Aphanomyces euteiches]|uniref:Uncharacterized protein n=1 Tax=Aphanomyces euteiches TaxID=100861 RepID=A0A6G0XHS8_9STRA|nr:hypothetical protein Ae201684_004815 [Aphanomyces euteiches]